MSDLATLGVNGALLVLIVLLVPCIYRMWRGPASVDRLQAIDTVTTLLIGIIVLLMLIRNDRMFVDIAIALAAFGFIGTLALARYISERRLF
ncbi:MAG: cation:proton antiporter [Chloroflexi bacterium]|nr:cation:proton antiporter [Chloroflexota bacterium]